MSLRSARLSALGTCALAFATLLTANLSAQQPKVMAPHKPIPPRVPRSLEREDPGVPRSMVGGFWMIDANRKASIYLKNGLETSSIAITPSLYLSNGVRYKLSPVTLEASGTAVVSINDALREKGISPWATLSGFVEVEYTWAWDPLCVSVTSTDPIHSTIFTYGLQPSVLTDLRFHISKAKLDGMYVTEGMWWKPEGGVTGFVALSNITAESIDARVQVSDNENNPLGVYGVRVSPHGTKIVSLRALEQAAIGATGGLRVLHTGTEEGLLINGGLEDQTSGYSANLPFHYRFSSAPQPSAPETYAELGLTTGAADPMMQFPAGTEFTPFSVARNVSDQPASVTPTFYWMQGSTAQSARLHSFTLLPFETRQLDVPSLLADAGIRGFNGSVNLILEARGQPRSLLLASGSVDRKYTYVFQVLPHGVQDSVAKTISYWSTAKGDDTMVTVWNPADESQDYRFTLFFAGGQYGLPIHLGARATRVFNISSIIENQIPDDNGNTIPGSVQEGSAKISGALADNQDILVALDAGTYNVRKATCTYYCISCDGEVLAYAVVTPFSVPKPRTQQLSVTIQDNHGNKYGTTGTWASSATTVATVGSTTGLVTAVSPGTATFTVSDFGNVYNSNYCAYDPFCPYNSSYQGSGNGTVTPDHLLVISDITSVSCTSSSNTVKRQIKYWAVDVNGNQVGTEQTKEQFASKGANSCNTTISTSETCSTDVGGQVIDQLFVGCNSVGGSCGTTYTKQQWLYCPPTGTPVVFATPGDVYLHNNSILVGGSSQFAAGTKIGPNGIMP
ncbi:MAG TPA: Ig-like domain-containing protein [Candidatus Sulfotelmatobacter sp.]